MVKDQEGDNRLSSVVGSVCLVHTKNSSSNTRDQCLGVCPRVRACVHACVCASVCFAFFCLYSAEQFSLFRSSTQSCEAGGSLHSISLTPFFMLKYLSQTGSTEIFAH